MLHSRSIDRDRVYCHMCVCIYNKAEEKGKKDGRGNSVPELSSSPLLTSSQRALFQGLPHHLLRHYLPSFLVRELFPDKQESLLISNFDHHKPLSLTKDERNTKISRCMIQTEIKRDRLASAYPATLTLLHLGPLLLYPFNLHLEKDKDRLGVSCLLAVLVFEFPQMRHNPANCSGCCFWNMYRVSGIVNRTEGKRKMLKINNCI